MRGAAGWLPIISSCTATVAIFYWSGVRLRLALLVCTLLWLANNIISHSIGGTVLETFIAIANISTIVGMLRLPAVEPLLPAKDETCGD